MGRDVLIARRVCRAITFYYPKWIEHRIDSNCGTTAITERRGRLLHR
jgi:hypothetical protein